MTVLVVDASALVVAALGTGSAAGVRHRLATEECHAPHLVDAELGSVLRRMVLRGVLPAAHGLTALRASARMITHRHEQWGRLGELAWMLRDNFTFYDALYVALADVLSAPLLTADHRLAGAPRLPCAIELVR